MRAESESPTETETVGERSQGVQPDVANDTSSGGFHLHANGTGSVHLVDALLGQSLVGVSFPSFLCQEGTIADTRWSAHADS
jgi:hypothetical protein